MLGIAAVLVLAWALWRKSRKRWASDTIAQFEQAFPSRCPICAYHRFGLQEDTLVDPHLSTTARKRKLIASTRTEKANIDRISVEALLDINRLSAAAKKAWDRYELRKETASEEYKNTLLARVSFTEALVDICVERIFFRSAPRKGEDGWPSSRGQLISGLYRGQSQAGEFLVQINTGRGGGKEISILVYPWHALPTVTM